MTWEKFTWENKTNHACVSSSHLCKQKHNKEFENSKNFKNYFSKQCNYLITDMHMHLYSTYTKNMLEACNQTEEEIWENLKMWTCQNRNQKKSCWNGKEKVQVLQRIDTFSFSIFITF